jgi:hypothetical protein
LVKNEALSKFRTKSAWVSDVNIIEKKSCILHWDKRCLESMSRIGQVLTHHRIKGIRFLVIFEKRSHVTPQVQGHLRKCFATVPAQPFRAW